MCGKTGTWVDSSTGGDIRDTDWYDLPWYGSNTADFTVFSPTVPLYVFLISSDEGWGVLGCTNVGVALQQVISPGTFTTFSWTRPGPEGHYCIWVGPQDYTGYPCDNDYILEVQGPLTSPSVPADVSIAVDTTSDPDEVTISWTDDGGNYNVYSAPTPTGTWTVLAQNINGGSYTYAAPATKTFYKVTNGVIVTAKDEILNIDTTVPNYEINLGTTERK